MRAYLAYILIMVAAAMSACTAHKSEEPPFNKPKLPVVDDLKGKYNRISYTDTLFNLDKPREKMVLELTHMTNDSIKRYGLDTMKFYNPFHFLDVAEGFSWMFGDLGYSSDDIRDKDGVEKEINSHVHSKVSIDLFVKRRDGIAENRGVFQQIINTDIIGVAKKDHHTLYAIGHPVTSKVRIADSYYHLTKKDSVPVKNYEDRVDSLKLVYVRFVIKPLFNTGGN